MGWCVGIHKKTCRQRCHGLLGFLRQHGDAENLGARRNVPFDSPIDEVKVNSEKSH